MGSHPINLGIRFLLEIAMLGAASVWGANFGNGMNSYVFAVGLPLALMIIWGVFAVPNDPSRSGNAPIPISGWIRLILELAIFAFGSWALIDLGYELSGWVLLSITTVHYLVSYDRIAWLIKQ